MINNEYLHELKVWFARYVSAYISEREECMMVKDEHTRRVCQNILIIARHIGLSEPDQNLAETIALFHDLGRFEQFKKYGTFNDSISENHSLLAINILRKFEVLNKIKNADQDFIYRCILNHNHYKITDTDSERSLLFSRMIRDADKIDIYRVLSDYYANPENHSSVLGLNLPQSNYFSEEIIRSLEKEEVAELNFAKTSIDFKLLQISWIYDINFDISFQIIEKQFHLQKITDSLPNNERISNIKNQMRIFFDKKLKLR